MIHLLLNIRLFVFTECKNVDTVLLTPRFLFKETEKRIRFGWFGRSTYFNHFKQIGRG